MNTNALPKTKPDKPLAIVPANKKDSFPKVIDESFDKPAPAAAAAATARTLTTKASSKSDQPQISFRQTATKGSRSKCTDDPTLAKMLAFAKLLADASGQVILKYFRRNDKMNAKTKDDHTSSYPDIVTEADIEV